MTMMLMILTASTMMYLLLLLLLLLLYSTTTTTTTTTTAEESVWVVNVGMKQFSGEGIVDAIINKQKLVKYLAPSVRSCFNQWIALREIKPIGGKHKKGRVRCAIQISPTPCEGPEWQKLAWGWDPEKPDRKAYKITAVRLLQKHMILKQSNQGGPWKLKLTDQYMEESAQLILALSRGISCPSTDDIVRMQNAPVTHRRQQERAARKLLRDKKRKQIGAFLRLSKRTGHEVLECCQQFCMHQFGCGFLNQQHVEMFSSMRQRFHELDKVAQRQFIRHRLVLKNKELGVRTNMLYLEPLETLIYYANHATLPLEPSCDKKQMVRVCRQFFMWVFSISNNKLDQPTMEGEFSVAMSGPRVPSWYDLGACDAIEVWLKNYAQGHLFDPSHENRIILFVATREAVYEEYCDAFKKKQFLYFPKDKKGVPFLPSQTYFLKVWRTSAALKKIVLRKFLKFTLCDKCVHFRDMRRVVLGDAEREALNRDAQQHRKYVREERNSYYWRRLLAQERKDEFLSIIIDGADQSAYALPHTVEKDKHGSGQMKIPLYLMGALVHGRGTYAFSYLKNIKHGTNVVTECLHRILMDIVAKETKLPPVLFLQVDNTTKQNKNQFLLGYAGCLVRWGLFKKVVISFLPVGHTHEDIDQMWSKVAGYLRTHNALDRKGILDAVAAGFKPYWGPDGAIVENLETAANISEWLKTYLANFSVQKHEFHQYQVFEDTATRQVMVQGRPRCVDHELNVWQAMDLVEGAMTSIFKKDPKPLDLKAVPPAQLQYHQKRTEDANKHAQWVRRISEGITKILGGFRQTIFSEQNKKDLLKCVELMQDTRPMKFHWDTSIYDNPPQPSSSSSRVEPLAPNAASLAERKQEEVDSGDDVDDDYGEVTRPQWMPGYVHVLKTEASPYWALVRFAEKTRIIPDSVNNHTS